jgi:hypothetical protein
VLTVDYLLSVSAIVVAGVGCRVQVVDRWCRLSFLFQLSVSSAGLDKYHYGLNIGRKRRF